MGASCIVHCNTVSKLVKGEYLLLCYIVMHYVFHTDFIYFSHVLNSFMSLYNENLKFREIFQKRGLEIFQNFHEIFIYFEVKYFIMHP